MKVNGQLNWNAFLSLCQDFLCNFKKEAIPRFNLSKTRPHYSACLKSEEAVYLGVNL